MSVKMKSSGQSGQKRGETETSYEERRTYGKYPNRGSHPLSQRICSNAISHYSTPFFLSSTRSCRLAQPFHDQLSPTVPPLAPTVASLIALKIPYWSLGRLLLHGGIDRKPFPAAPALPTAPAFPSVLFFSAIQSVPAIHVFLVECVGRQATWRRQLAHE